MRLTVRSDLAMRTLMFCAVNSDRLVRKAEIALACNASENHLGVVVNMLGHHGFVETARGRHGGIRLKMPAEALSLGAVFRAFEAGVPFVECFDGTGNGCPLTPTCRLKPALSRALDAFYSALDDVTLADLVAGNSGLESLLGAEAA